MRLVKESEAIRGMVVQIGLVLTFSLLIGACNAGLTVSPSRARRVLRRAVPKIRLVADQMEDANATDRRV